MIIINIIHWHYCVYTYNENEYLAGWFRFLNVKNVLSNVHTYGNLEYLVGLAEKECFWGIIGASIAIS